MTVADSVSVSFTIPGRIGGKQRAGRQIIHRPGQMPIVRSYNPALTTSREAIVRTLAALEMRKRRHGLLKGPLSLSITVFQQPPVSWSGKRRREAWWITGKPDWDNIGKLISDALNGIVWRDDSQVSKADFARMYDTERGECVIVAVRELGARP